MAKLIDLTGKKFGRLVVLKKVRTKNSDHSSWLCRCVCGKEKRILSQSLKSGVTQSCGCGMKKTQFKKGIIAYNRRHLMTGKRFYTLWQGMKQRCLNKNASGYKKYGEKGISICARWSKFDNFMEDMYVSYLSHVKKHGKKNTQIDRIDFLGNYEPSNCRFVTILEQAGNKRNVKKIFFNGKEKTIPEWAKEIGISTRALRTRLSNWSVEKSLQFPIRRRRQT